MSAASLILVLAGCASSASSAFFAFNKCTNGTYAVEDFEFKNCFNFLANTNKCDVTTWSAWGPCVAGETMRTRAYLAPDVNTSNCSVKLSQTTECLEARYLRLEDADGFDVSEISVYTGSNEIDVKEVIGLNTSPSYAITNATDALFTQGNVVKVEDDGGFVQLDFGEMRPITRAVVVNNAEEDDLATAKLSVFDENMEAVATSPAFEETANAYEWDVKTNNVTAINDLSLVGAGRDVVVRARYVYLESDNAMSLKQIQILGVGSTMNIASNIDPFSNARDTEGESMEHLTNGDLDTVVSTTGEGDPYDKIWIDLGSTRIITSLKLMADTSADLTGLRVSLYAAYDQQDMIAATPELTLTGQDEYAYEFKNHQTEWV